ncbi:MAG: sodium:proton antiporter [Sulfurimonas sp.]|nr:sodium:proton antiporter [Sulfurimonas sp.]
MVSLFSGIVVGIFILNSYVVSDTIVGIFDLAISLLSQMWILKTLAFIILVGSIMALIDRSGGIGGLIDYVQNRKKIVNSKRSALFLSYIIGVLIFVETSITALVSGAVGRAFCKEYKISNAKLAYVCDSTSAPISSLIVFNGYGALLLGLITTQIDSGMIAGNGIDLLINSLLYNFYAIITLIIVFLSIWFDIDIGPMKNSKYTQLHETILFSKQASKYLMILPIALMVILVFVFLYITGDGNILKGSGSSAVFYTMLSTIAFMFIYYIPKKIMNIKTFTLTTYKGSIHLLPIAFIMLAAFGLSDITSELKTGQYLASFANENLNIYLLASIVFLLSAITAFATGTSWGTYGIMLPIAIPIAVSMDADVPLLIGAVVSGAIFGDHSSPISDTTIISSLAADCEVSEHVKTQLPYALISAFLTMIMFSIVSIYIN